MSFIHNWRQVLARAWSLWAIYAALAVEAMEAALPQVGEYIPGWASAAILVAGIFLRLKRQRDLPE